VKGKYTVNEVEERINVPASTLRQWERRYNFPNPERSESGYRLYSEADLQNINAMKRHIDDGIPASRAAELVRRMNPAAKGPRPLREMQQELVNALLNLDEDRADTVLSEAHTLHPVESVMFELIHPGLVQIGQMWHDRIINTTIEHYSSSYIYGRLRSLLSLSSNIKTAPAVIVACAPTDQHELGPLMLAVALRRAGYRVYYVGANTPVSDLFEMSNHIMPLAIMVSASTAKSAEKLLEEQHFFKNVSPHIIFGGSAFNENPELARTLGGIYLAGDIPRAIEEFDHLVQKVKTS
jgi:MerR family transcriptional regulator, light-induced transcriptional regulator